MTHHITSHWICRTILEFAILSAVTNVVFAQTAPPATTETAHPTFAVSAVKASGPDSPTRSIHFLPGGRFTATGVNVRLLIKIAYNLNDDQLNGGPAWLGEKRFDIDAAPDAPDRGTHMAHNHLRLQALLADRFQLRMHDGMKTMSTYALMLAKRGPKLKKSQTQDAPMQAHGSNGAMMLTNASMDQFANAVSDWVGHPVLNQTGLDGKYDLRLQWSPDQPPAPADSSDTTASLPKDSGPTIFTALQQQLGLSLVARKNQALCKVVEHVELPMEN